MLLAVDAGNTQTVYGLYDGDRLAEHYRIGTNPTHTADELAVTLRALDGVNTLERGDIKKMELSPVSMMPEGLLEAISETQVRDLIGYLMQKTQVPLPEEK